jgi:hypothetical protein
MFTQKKNNQWMWAKEHRDEMRSRLYWVDYDFPFDKEVDWQIAENSWIWNWSHTCNIGYKSLGVFEEIIEHLVIAKPVEDANYTYRSAYGGDVCRMRTSRFVVLTDEEKQFVKDYILPVNYG